MMSQIHGMTKDLGCGWTSKAWEFINRNRTLIGYTGQPIKKRDYPACEDALVVALKRLVANPPMRQVKSVSAYAALKEYMASPEGARKWREVRFEALRASGGKCCLCGASPRVGAVLHVDHIKPKSLYPKLAFEVSNLQVLCSDCNLGKGNRSEDDFR